MIFVLKGNWIILLSTIVFLFVGIYVYAASSTFLENLRGKKAYKNKLIKEEEIRLLKIKNDGIRAEKHRLIDERSSQIKEELAWLEELNQKINKKTGKQEEKVG
jgi:hypothetical protein